MVCYKSGTNDDYLEIGNQWKVKIKDGKMRLSHEKQYYDVGEFTNCTEYKLDKEPIYYSFDEGSYNFHIVPAYSSKDFKDKQELQSSQYIVKCNEIFKIINDILKTEGFGLKMRSGNPQEKYTGCHRYKILHVDEYEYMISFNRLWCKDNCINNNLGQVQFYCYPKDTDINRIDTGKTKIWRGEEKTVYAFKMMYPLSPADGVKALYEANHKKGNTKHCVYNPSIKEAFPKRADQVEIEKAEIKEYAETIATEFIKFIKES